MHHLKTALLCGVGMTLLAACSGQSGSAGHSGHGDNAAPAAKPASIEQLASRTGCSPSSKRSSEELRQAACQTSKGRYTLVSFTTDQGQQSWLTEAKPWGGSYLIGPRWVVVATAPILQSLRSELGGKILNGEHHG
jgi:hypothetical protein